ncbi:MAG TPA: hypothetical protein VE261_02490 [Gaiellaceae bacterium]|nr:hypothetical protein [Gaiellaceae bacterium]
MMVEMAAENNSVQREIEALLVAPSSGEDAPTLARVEETLTEGYAEALVLEAERLRLERRLSEAARDSEGAGVGEELRELGTRLRSADGELVKLRALLGSLHERARSLRKGD